MHGAEGIVPASIWLVLFLIAGALRLLDDACVVLDHTAPLPCDARGTAV